MSPPTTKERLAIARKARERQAEREGRIRTPEGFDRSFKAKLQAAEKRHRDDPKARELLERAQLKKRVEAAKREHGITDRDPPTKFMGVEPDEFERAAASAIPPSIREMREGRQQPKKKKAGGK